MQALVSATQGRIKRAWLALVVHLREENSASQIEARLHSGAVLGVRQAAGLFAAEHVNAYINAGRQTARWVASALKSPHLVRKALPIFDPVDPPAARFAAQNRLDLIQEIDEQTRSMIHDVLLEGARSGANPKDIAREIRDSIGLTDHQTKIVANYRRQLEDGQYAAALRRELSSGNSDRVIASAMRSNKALSKAQIDQAVDRYRTNMIARRAEDIARTEGLRVAHRGSEELYRQAVERGDLQAEQIERTWNHHPGKKSSKNDRAFHKVMHGQVRGYGEKFVSGLGAELRYPGDPEASGEETISCACALSTRLKPATGAASTGRPGLGGGAAEEGEATGEPAEVETEVIDEEAMDEEIADEEAAAEEEPVDAEEQAAEEADAEGAAEDAEATDLEPGEDLSPEDLADLLGEPAFDFPSNPEFTPEQRRHQQLQQQLQRLRDQKDAVKQAEADLADAKTTHAQLQADLRTLIDSHAGGRPASRVQDRGVQRNHGGGRRGHDRVAGATEASCTGGSSHTGASARRSIPHPGRARRRTRPQRQACPGRLRVLGIRRPDLLPSRHRDRAVLHRVAAGCDPGRRGA
jgi:hypothetical protein